MFLAAVESARHPEFQKQPLVQLARSVAAGGVWDCTQMCTWCYRRCNKCVDAVAKTTKGKKEPLPAPCKTAYK